MARAAAASSSSPARICARSSLAAPRGFPVQPASPRVAQIRLTGTPARLWRRMRPPQPIDSSSGCAITTRRPWAFSIATHDSPAPLLLASVLHLPGMIERVPRHASGDIRHRPLLDSIRIRQALENRLAERSHGRLLRAFRLLQAQADLPCVTPFSAEDVDEHRVTIPSPAARPLAQGRGSLRDNLVEVLPASRDQISHAFGLLGVERPGFIFGRDSRRAEIRGGIAPEAFDNFEGWVGRERNPGQPGHGRVSRRIGRERVEGGLLTFSGARPARPVSRAREGLFFADLEKNASRRILSQGHADYFRALSDPAWHGRLGFTQPQLCPLDHPVGAGLTQSLPGFRFSIESNRYTGG